MRACGAIVLSVTDVWLFSFVVGPRVSQPGNALMQRGKDIIILIDTVE